MPHAITWRHIIYYSITLYHIISYNIIYGPCDDAFPSSLRAELWAILHTLRMAIPPLTIWTDSEGVVERWSKGETWCCAACRLAADLWRDIWRLLGDMGPVVSMLSVLRDMQLMLMSQRSGAPLGKGLATTTQTTLPKGLWRLLRPGSPLINALRAEFKHALQWYAWLAALIGHWPADAQKKIKTAEPPARSQRRRRQQPAGNQAATSSHEPAAEEEAATPASTLAAVTPASHLVPGTQARSSEASASPCQPGAPCL